ncbi:hypothetical protein ElyMa_002676000 [Elysia marginata]|uniref:Uncharacterized protein n=1 Tax=Elysia marginata TaxID=1093978 RepID=A0AAV4HDX4_9GAST|nr:hypothetical protein ElyMa_002676000 [Elysia marginata]
MGVTTENMPASSQLPLITQFLAIMVAISVLSVLATVVSLVIHHKQQAEQRKETKSLSILGKHPNTGQRGRVVNASDSRSGGRGFDSRPCHVAVALGKQFTLTFPSPPTCKMGTQLQAILEFVICACNTLHRGLKCPYWSAGALVALLLWRHSYAE